MSDILKNILIITSVLVFVLLGKSTCVEAFRIPSESMVPTLKVNDYILVWKLAYGLHIPFYTETITDWEMPDRKDQIVFLRKDDPETEMDEARHYMIKRVIGLPGERLEVKGTKVYINDIPLKEPYAVWKQGGNKEGDFGPITIPEGKLFVMGDNRDHSKDSRFWTDSPFVSRELVVGRAFIIYLSTNNFSRIGTILR